MDQGENADLLLDGDAPLRIELQLKPGVSALERAHVLHHVGSCGCLHELMHNLRT